MLKRILNQIPENRPIWQFGKTIYTKNDITSFILKNQNVGYKEYINKNIVLHLNNQIILSHLLVFFDGLAKNIIIIPEEIDLNTGIENFNKLKIDFLIKDRTEYSELKNVNKIIDSENFFKSSSEEDEHKISETKFLNSDCVKTKWLLATSGTTGSPKLISHSRSSLTRTTKQNFDKGLSYCWGLMYQIARFAGLQVFLQSFSSGSKLIFLKNENLQEDCDQLKEAGCNAISATPTMFRKLLMGSNFSDLKLKQITLGGEISDQKLIDKLKDAFNDTRITQVYASTEAGVGFAVNDGYAGFPKKFLDSDLNDIQIRVSKDNILMLKSKNSDEIEGKNFLIQKDRDGFINSGDVVELKNGRYFFLGRLNGAINVGGNKVHPEEVENVIKELSEVKMVSVFSKKNPILGQIVAANIVPSTNLEVKKFKHLVINHCKEALEDFKVPISINIVQNIGTNKSGKVIRS